MKPRILLAGNPSAEHAGAHFRNAAVGLGLPLHFCDSTRAFRAPAWRAKLDWWLRGHRPSRLEEFSNEVLEACRSFRPEAMLALGLAPVSGRALAEIGALGVRRWNFPTDDPWNPAHRAPWYLENLPLYDHVFTPRRANLADFQAAGCARVSYLPFAYAPEIHFPEPAGDETERARLAADVLFVGGGDADRLPPVTALIQAGFRVALYGGYWNRHAATRSAHRGMADPPLVRKATSAARIVLALVREANRDGHAMRSFEAPAMGACLLAQETAEHREILGDTVAYFRTIPELIEQARTLLQDENRRTRLAAAARARITAGGNTYADRWQQIFTTALRP